MIFKLYFMKNNYIYFRRLFFAVLLLMPFSAQAQYSHLYYHCQRDTVIGDAETYYHSWWDFENSLQTQQIYHILNMPLAFNKVLLYHYTPTPLQVVGLAILPRPIVPPPFTDDPYYFYDTSAIREYLYLCEAGIDTTYELAKVRWLPADTSRFIKICHTELSGLSPNLPLWSYESRCIYENPSHICCGGDPYTNITHVAEYYFDQPITVSDSFYVGCSNISCTPGSGYNIPDQHYLVACQTGSYDCNGDTINWYNPNSTDNPYLIPADVEPVCAIMWPAIVESHWNDYDPMYHSDDWLPDGTYYGYVNEIPMVFPIVMVDTTVPPHSYCPSVENLQLASYSPGCIDLSWDAFVNHRSGYEIFYGRRNQPESEWTTRFTWNNFAQLCDLDPRFFYEVRVIPVCDKDQNSAQWVVSAPFRPDGSSAVSVTEPSALSRHTTLSPNPTTGIVHIHSDYVITRLDIYDTEGRHLDFYAYPGRDADLDLSNYAPGLYHLVISTPQGRTTKQIIKE